MLIEKTRALGCRFTAALLAVLFVSTAADASDASPKRPNLVFVFSDQHSWDMLGCYGNKDVVTPNFDRLAEQGVRFNHCISNSPVCTPYRGILMTGQHPLRCGAITNDLQVLPGNGNYFAQVLRDAGYRTGYYGKWHLYGGDRRRPIPPGPYRYGFDHEFLTNNCTLLFDKKRAYYWDENGEKQLYGDWEPYAQTRQAMEFVDRHAGKPFALFLSWHPPHNWGSLTGYAAPEDCLKLYDAAKLHLRLTVKDTPQVRQMYRGHMAMITSLDRAFGWLMKKLENRGLKDNTIVVFTADHGDMLLSYDWPRHKGRPEHLSCRVPLLIRFPGRLDRRVSELIIGTFDLMPTLLGMMDLPVPKTCEGRNLSGAIAECKDDVVESQPLFLLPADWRGVYTRRYTYSYSLHDSTSASKAVPESVRHNRLFDRQEDPWETRNLYDLPEYATVRQRLHQQTLEWMKRFGDTGFICRPLLQKALRAEDWPAFSAPPPERPRGWEGRLKGRPIDFFR